MATGRIEVDGIAEVRAALRRVDRQFPRELRRVLNEVGELIAEETARVVPRRTGRLADSIRPLSTQTEGRVVMGTEKRVPYAGWVDFGGGIPSARSGRPPVRSRPYVREGRYLYPTFARLQGEISRRAQRALDAFSRRVPPL